MSNIKSMSEFSNDATKRGILETLESAVKK